MSPPAAAKRRHFDHKREQDQDEDDEEDNVIVVNKMTSGRDRLDLESGGAELNNVSVNAKIGHFERLLQHAAPQHDSKLATGTGNKCLYRHQPIDDDSLYEGREFGNGRAQCDAHDGLLNEAEMVDDLDDDDYLGLDTIVEEDEVDDEEALARHAAAASTRTQATLRNNNCDNNIRSGTRLPAINIDTSHMNNDDDDDDTGGGGNEKYCAIRDTGNHIDTPSRPPAEMTTVIGDGGGSGSSSKVHLCRQPRAVETEEQQRQQKSPTTISENNDDELASGNNNYNNNNSFDTNNSVSMEGQLGPSGASPESIDNLTNSSLSTTTTSTTTNPTTSSTSQEQTSDNNNKRIGGPNMSEPKIQQQQAYQPLLLPSTNRLISEHQARQQQTLFKALAERQKLLDELGPDERQQQADLMSSCLNPAFWRRRPSQQQHQNGHLKSSSRAKQRKTTTKRRRESASASQKQQQQQHVQLSNYVTLKLRPNEASSKSGKSAAASSSASSSSSSSSKGVPLSAVDLSSVSDRMLDDLLGHIASASSSSSKAGSLDSSDLSSLSGSGNEDDNLRDDDDDSSTESELASSCRSPPSSFDEDDDDDAGQRQRRSGPIRRHRRKHSHADASGFVAQHTSQAGDHQAPSVIGVHDEADAASLVGSPPTSGRQLVKQSAVRSAAASRKCREAYKKSRRGPDRSDEDDDYHDEDQNRRNQGDLAINSASAGSGSLTSHRTGGKPNGCSLSPASTRRQLNSSSTTVPSDNNSSDPRLAGPHPSESPTTSDEPSSMSLPMGPSDLDRDELRPTHRDQHQSVEAILGRMLEALQEVGLQQQQQQRQGEEQEQLNDLLERGFLHLEQLLNCSLAPRSTTGTLSQAQRAQSDSPGGSQLVGHQQALASSHHLQAPSMPNPSISSSQQATSAMFISGGGGSHIMLSKDSDYGSDTQSADCFSHSTSSGASNSSPAASGPQLGRSHALTSKLLSSSSSSSPSSATLPSQQQHATAIATHRHQFDHKDQDQQQRDGGLCETAPCDTVPTSEGALSPLAIELSFKLAESLRNLAQQQQRATAAARAQREEQLSARAPAASAIGANNDHTDDDDDDASDQDCLQSESMTTASRLQLKAANLDDDNSKIDEPHGVEITTQAPQAPTSITPTTPTSVRTRMKSVVMINSPASCNSSLASRPHSSQSSASSQLSATVASGNMTPVDCGRSSSSLSRQPSSSVSSHSAAQRQQFKTFVNLNSSSESAAAASNKTTTTTTSSATAAAVSCSGANSATQTIVKVVAASRGAGALGRRPRSSFRSSSLRRKSSFSGSIGGGVPRPGSPVPRSALADTPLQLRGQKTVDEPKQLQANRVKTSTTSMEAARASPNQAALESGADGQAGSSNQASATSVRQQRQLQRALILAQKYNYSPAKLAASKLGLELQLAGAAVKTPTKGAVASD